MKPPTVSIITAVFNDPRVERALESIRNQDYHGSIETVVVDGGDDSNTQRAIDAFGPDCLIREPDKGIYDAMNKGIEAASGDVIGILNADDQYAAPSVLRQAVKPIADGAHASYGDIVIEDDQGNILRTWRAGHGRWCFGWMPPHPSVFVHREVYEQAGKFRLDLPIAADYEFMLRSFRGGTRNLIYVPQTTVRMAAGGASQASLRAVLSGWQQTRQSWQVHGSRWGPVAATLKPARKVGQFFSRAQQG
ncbi:MAG: glycosyltransferase family 2 protein [Thermoplasmatota archaeon]